MYLSPSDQDRAATQIAAYIRLTAAGYGAVASTVGRAGYPEAAAVAITETGKTDCTAKVAIYYNRLAYVSGTRTYILYPTRWEGIDRIVRSFLSTEGS